VTEEPSDPARDTRGRYDDSPAAMELAYAAARLKAQGLSFREIAKAQGVSSTTAWHRVKKAWAALQPEDLPELRAQAAEALDIVKARMFAILLADHIKVDHGRIVLDGNGNPLLDRGPNIQAAGAIIRAEESRRRIFGVDAPSQVRVLVSDQVTLEIETLARELGVLDPTRQIRELEVAADSTPDPS
jgi:hypothetical protein